MTVGWIVTGVGVAVSLLGWYMVPNPWGYGIFGFGLAHIVLGILEMFRTPEKNRNQAPNS